MQVLLAGIVHTHIHFAAVIESTSCEVYPNQADLLSWISTLAIVFGLASNVAPGKLTTPSPPSSTSLTKGGCQGKSLPLLILCMMMVAVSTNPDEERCKQWRRQHQSLHMLMWTKD
ncbi:cortexin domain-containing 1 protein isoform X2 [Caretta caretta]|uniref:cortexin domain-containing 1 protein isoform X2 n=1 Tax=Caretta caretta TaxID=8467 RepID=UPI003F4B5FAE